MCYLIIVPQFNNDIIFVMIQSVLHGSGSLFLLLHYKLYHRLRMPIDRGGGVGGGRLEEE